MTQAVSEDMTYVTQECLRYMRQVMECKTVLRAQLPAFSLPVTVLASALQIYMNLHEHAWSNAMAI